MKQVSTIRTVLFPAICALGSMNFVITASARTNTVTLSYTGSVQTWTVPSGVTRLTVRAVGSSGASTTSAAGGLGAVVSGDLNVVPTQQIYIYVGGQSRFNGGGGPGISPHQIGAVGGDATDIRINGTNFANRILVAGGGGGGGGTGSSAIGGSGGSSALNGLDGGRAANNNGSYGGGGATQSAGGLRGSPGPQPDAAFGFAGSLGIGGNGGTGGVLGNGGGGGGGGGYYGGGGGGSGDVYRGGGGGGGGSSFVDPNFVSNATFETATTSGVGYVTISYYLPLPPPDTDNDGVNNYREGKDGTDPNDATSFNLLSKGLVAYYPFNGNVNDESGAATQVTAVHTVLTDSLTDGANTAYAFNGTSSYMTASGVPMPTNGAYSWSIWIQPTSEANEMSLINRVYALGMNFLSPALTLNAESSHGASANRTATLYSFNDALGGSTVTTPANVFASGKWTHLVATRSTDGVGSIFVDGVKVIEGPCYESQGPWELFVFGANGQGPTSFFNGKMDNIRIYNRTISPSEVKQLFYTEGFTDIQKSFVATNAPIFGLYSLSEYNTNRTNGQTDVTTNPSAFNLFTQTEYEGFGALQFSNGISSVLSNPSAFNLFTQSEYESFGALQFSGGQSSVTTNPSDHGLFTQNDIAESFSQGQNSVLQSIPSVDVSVPSSSPVRVTLGGPNVVGVVVDDTQTPLPGSWYLDESAGELVGKVEGTNPISVVLEGEFTGARPSIRIPINFHPQGGQTIAPFARVPTQRFGSEPLTVTPPVATSGLPVALSVKSGPATINGNEVTFTGVGRIVLAANQMGSQDVNAAPEVTTSFVVTKGRQSIDFPALNSMPFVQGDTFELSPTASSGLPIVYRSTNPRVISISGSTATIVGRGRASIRASQPGNENWNPANSVVRPIRIF